MSANTFRALRDLAEAQTSLMDKVYSESTTAPVNIAVIKYWGKRDPVLNLPTNSSISVTLSQDDLRAWTTTACSATFSHDRMWLNGQERDITTDKRLAACLKKLRDLRSNVEFSDSSAPALSKMALHIASENNFPTAAGLASSAAGFAALVRCIADLYQLPDSPTVLSRIARQGSGSACRSLLGGFVAWEVGNQEDGSDSQAVQIAPLSHWPSMRACIMVASVQKKDISSTNGMQTTTKTSTLFNERIKSVVPQRLEEMKTAILGKRFNEFAELTMRDSNQFHAVCLDSYPPIFYMNDISRSVVRLVEYINAQQEDTLCAYTFDAGPNAVIYYLAQVEHLVLPFIYAAIDQSIEGARELTQKAQEKRSVPEGIREVVKRGVERVILTSIGDGPRSAKESLLDDNGLPIHEK